MEATQPANGGTEVLSGDRVRYTPDDAFGGGEDPFTYTLCETVDANGGKDCDSATVTVTVIGGRDPVPVDDPDATTLRDQPVSILVTANDVKPDPAKLEVRTAPKDGTAVVQEQPRTATSCTPLRLHRHGQLHLRLLPLGGRLTARAACRFATG